MWNTSGMWIKLLEQKHEGITSSFCCQKEGNSLRNFFLLLMINWNLPRARILAPEIIWMIGTKIIALAFQKAKNALTRGTTSRPLRCFGDIGVPWSWAWATKNPLIGNTPIFWTKLRRMETRMMILLQSMTGSRKREYMIGDILLIKWKTAVFHRKK